MGYIFMLQVPVPRPAKPGRSVSYYKHYLEAEAANLFLTAFLAGASKVNYKMEPVGHSAHG